MTQIWFTSDLHLAHKKVAEIRGFKDTAEHDAMIMSNLAEVGRVGDTMWILGDLSGGSSEAEDYALEQLDRLTSKFTLNLIWGNHDTAHPKNSHADKRTPKFLEVFAHAAPYAKRMVDTERVWMSHFPYKGDGDRDELERYPEVRLPDMGDWLLHGHLHTPKRWTAHRSLHVGLDAWGFKPIELQYIITLMRNRRLAQTGKARP